MPDTFARVGIDCRLAGCTHAGIGRYTENLVRELVKLPATFQLVLFFSTTEQAEQVLPTKKDRERVEIRLTPIRHYSLSEQLLLPKIFAAARLDLLHVPHFNIPVAYTGKLVVTIHDLLWHEYRGKTVTTLPAWVYWPKYVMYRWTVNKAVQQATQIIVPAQTVADQVKKYYPAVAKKIVVALEGVEPHFYQPLSASPIIPKKQLVYIGSLYPHKNIQVVLNTLTQLPEYRLLLVSARTVFLDQVRHQVNALGLTQRVQFLGYQSDQAVAQLLQESTALVQPSLSEGFGLTGLEGMAAGAPVIASDILIFREIYKAQAIFFTAQDPESFMAAVKQAATIRSPQRLAAAQNFARQYQWSVMAKEIATVYDTVLAKP